MEAQRRVEIVSSISERILANTRIKDQEYARQKVREWLR